ncbi:MAG: hypothetical protein SNJ52_05215, partial [Verrucomicrobiia bacterium]
DNEILIEGVINRSQSGNPTQLFSSFVKKIEESGMFATVQSRLDENEKEDRVAFRIRAPLRTDLHVSSDVDLPSPTKLVE